MLGLFLFSADNSHPLPTFYPTLPLTALENKKTRPFCLCLGLGDLALYHHLGLVAVDPGLDGAGEHILGRLRSLSHNRPP